MDIKQAMEPTYIVLILKENTVKRKYGVGLLCTMSCKTMHEQEKEL